MSGSSILGYAPSVASTKKEACNWSRSTHLPITALCHQCRSRSSKAFVTPPQRMKVPNHHGYVSSMTWWARLTSSSRRFLNLVMELRGKQMENVVKIQKAEG